MRISYAGFCWDVLSEAKNKAAITGQNVMKLMREAYEVFILSLIHISRLSGRRY